MLFATENNKLINVIRIIMYIYFKLHGFLRPILQPGSVRVSCCGMNKLANTNLGFEVLQATIMKQQARKGVITRPLNTNAGDGSIGNLDTKHSF